MILCAGGLLAPYEAGGPNRQQQNQQAAAEQKGKQVGAKQAAAADEKIALQTRTGLRRGGAHSGAEP
jgi:hypothetical protein